MTGNRRAPQDKLCSYEYTVKRGDSFYLIAHKLGVPLRDLLEANSDVNPARLMVGDVLCIPMEEDDAVQEPACEKNPTPEVKPAPEQPQPEAAPILQAENIVPGVQPETAALAEEPADWLDHPAVTENALTETIVTQTRTAEAAPEPTPQPIAQVTAQPEASQAAACPDCPNGECYTVAAGETIIDIQRAADKTLYALQAANPTADLDALKAGQKLCIPKENAPCPAVSIYVMGKDDTLETVALKHDVSVGALLRANPCLAPSGFVAGTLVCLPVSE